MYNGLVMYVGLYVFFGNDWRKLKEINFKLILV